MFDRMRAIYPALASTFAHAWLPLVVGLGVVAVLFRMQPQA
jgi:hypothetical protein